MDTAKEEKLVARARGGDRRSFGVLMRRHRAAVAALVLSRIHDAERAEEAAQAAFVKAYENLRRFEGRSTFKTWVSRIALNEASSGLREALTARIAPLSGRPLWSEGSDWESRLDGPDGTLGATERRLDLESALEGLAPRERQMADLRLEGYALREIAELLGVSAGTVKSTLFSATRKMRRCL